MDESVPPSLDPAAGVNANPWESAYLRFETPRQEVRKFMGRLLRLGAQKWSRDAEVVELFCGRGSGLLALARLGFTRIEGVDLSEALVRQYRGPGVVHVGDCRELPFENTSKDIAIVQGGLHHLAQLPEDLDRTLAEIRRVLRRGGMFVAVEPWLTPFLKAVHCLCGFRTVRWVSGKFDALATMIEHEQQTYDRWLGQPETILTLMRSHFAVQHCETGWGKLMFRGHKL